MLGLLKTCFILTITFKHVFAHGNTNKLMLFLLDGFRWDYFDQPGVNLPGFSRIINSGAKAEYMVSDFTTLSYPNYYSIMTGIFVIFIYLYTLYVSY